MAIGTMCVLFLFGYLNQGYREEKIKEDRERSEQETKAFEKRQKDENLFKSHLSNELGVNFKDLHLFDDELSIELVYADITEEIAQTVSVDILKYLQRNNSEYDVEIRITSETRNAYGQNVVYQPFIMEVSKDLLYEFNFDFFDLNNLKDTVDYYVYYEE